MIMKIFKYFKNFNSIITSYGNAEIEINLHIDFEKVFMVLSYIDQNISNKAVDNNL